VEVSIKVPLGAERVSVLGAAERNLKMIRESLGVNVTAREGLVHLRGEGRAVSVARSVLEQLGSASGRRRPLTRQEVLEVIADQSARAAREGEGASETTSGRARARGGAPDGDLDVYAAGRQIRPKTANQERYLEAIRNHDLVFAIGPAGTGKTYLAVAAAVHLLRTDQVRRLMLVRPAVEAGERLGFLPGDLSEKVNPYLRPLFDALHDMLDYPTIKRFFASDVVEVAPLAFMRGRTLNNAVIILDEAQNTTKGQMKMFLTRMGQGSKTIVTGDTTQIDLPDPRESGLIDAARRLRRVEGVSFVTLDKEDVVRHELVQRVVEAYGGDDAPEPSARAAP
jgi:phosphate starvation-inducible protein PhoH and related proteins